MTREKQIEAMAEAIAIEMQLMGIGYIAETRRLRLDNGSIYMPTDNLAKAALTASSVHAELERVKAENERLREALEFYARNHHHLPTNGPNWAHEALATIERIAKGK